MKYEEALEKLSEIDEHGENLSPWEIEFVADLIDRATSPNGKELHLGQNQIAKIDEIHLERVKR